MAAGCISAVMDSTARDNHNIAVIPDIKIIINHFLKSALTEKHRNVYALFLRSGLDLNIDAGNIRFRNNVNVGCRISGCTLTVCTDIVCSCRDFMKPGYSFQKFFLYAVHALSPPTTYVDCAGASQKLRQNLFFNSMICHFTVADDQDLICNIQNSLLM